MTLLPNSHLELKYYYLYQRKQITLKEKCHIAITTALAAKLNLCIEGPIWKNSRFYNTDMFYYVRNANRPIL